MASEKTAAGHAAELLAALCSSAATEHDRLALALLVQREHITLAEFAAALSELADERGAAAYGWDQEGQSPLSRLHSWRLRRAEDVPLTGQAAELDVRLRCEHCGAVATFKVGAVPPCQPGQRWQYSAQGWQRDG